MRSPPVRVTNLGFRQQLAPNGHGKTLQTGRSGRPGLVFKACPTYGSLERTSFASEPDRAFPANLLRRPARRVAIYRHALRSLVDESRVSASVASTGACSRCLGPDPPVREHDQVLNGLPIASWAHDREEVRRRTADRGRHRYTEANLHPDISRHSPSLPVEDSSILRRVEELSCSLIDLRLR